MDGRTEPPHEADERTTLLGFLQYHRDTLAMKCEGLDAEQLARRSLAPSTMSLLGLVRHLAEVERGWLSHFVEDELVPRYYTDDEPDLDFDGAVADQPAIEEAFAYWRSGWKYSDAIATTTALDQTFSRQRQELQTFSLRWVLVHLVEEYARHNGHADLLREHIDGATGE